jgi:primary-amine oxidase
MPRPSVRGGGMSIAASPARSSARRSGPGHPLDPLSGPELAAAARIARAAAGWERRVRVIDVSLYEPAKAAVLAFDGGVAPPREAWVVLWEPSSGRTFEIVVDIGAEEARRCDERHDVQPAITTAEFAECERVVRADPGVREALRRRGVTDVELLMVEAWGIGTHAPIDERGRRLVWTPCWIRDDADDNPYAHPIEGLYPIVDLNAMEVIRIEEHGVWPIPRTSGRYRPDLIGVPLRDDVKPLQISQPDGPSFEVDGWEVRWQRWRFRVGFTAREGLILHQLGYEDGESLRPICYRASFGELVVPYGDPSPGGYRKAAFDIGEYGLGMLTNSLTLGCDCVGNIHYFDAELCNDAGEPYTIENAICLHEEDAGILWKHYDASSGHAEVRRARRLVISFIITAANYEYGFYWYLYQDGTIESEVKATGIVLTQGAVSADRPAHGTVVAPSLIAPHHQHFFCVRLDMQVDGFTNSVYEVDSEPLPPGPENPHGNAFTVNASPIVRESEARRLIDPLRARYWTIANPDRRNAHGEPVAYKLVPGQNVGPMALPGSDIRRRAGFLDAHFWVTAYDRGERFPAGEYPNQHPGGDGLPRFQLADRPLEGADIVIWYTFGSHHIVRPEDWPVMPVERLGFSLKAAGFFDRNPALDVPPAAHLDGCARTSEPADEGGRDD